ncbi:hypothetical protein [Priestia megaterium]|uniref:hypothetical protein n=1 Tax=Priestia megaterium TaxID=1404 RepID=UPI003CC5706A
MRRKVVFLQDNMIDENERVIFEADIPYVVENGFIENEDGLKVSVESIWVDFHLVHQKSQ